MPAEDTIRKGLDAFNRHDPDAFAAMYTPDALAYDPQYPEPVRGKEALRKDIEDFFTAFPDIHLTLTDILSKGNTVAFAVSVTGTHKGPLSGPAGTIPATNRRVEMPVAVFARANAQDLIVEERRYYDMAGMMQQLGLMGQ